MQHLQPNTTLQGGKYRIERVLGQGGFGITYLARNTVFDIDVAIKEFFIKEENERDGSSVTIPNSTKSELFIGQKEKFKKEAKRMLSIKNEHIVCVHDLFEENGTAYYVMDYVKGESLAATLKRTGKSMPEQQVLFLMPQILDALAAIHNIGIWHLDLKPANIMVDIYGNVKLIDFGASKQINTQKGGATTSTAISYTNGYAPREQMEQNYDKFGPWTDIYALGATLYNLLTNRRPPLPTDIDDDETIDKHNILPFPDDVSNATKSLVLLMMNTNRILRPQNVDVIINAEKMRIQGQKKTSKQSSTVNNINVSDEESTIIADARPKNHETKPEFRVEPVKNRNRDISLSDSENGGIVYTSECLKENTNIHGWLLFFLISIALDGLIGTCYSIFSQDLDDSASDIFLICAVVFLGICLLGIAIYVPYAFLKRKSNAVFWAKFYIISALILNLMSILDGDFDTYGVNSLAHTVIDIVWYIVLLLYFSFSDQVKEIIPVKYRKTTKYDRAVVAGILLVPVICLFVEYVQTANAVMDRDASEKELLLRSMSENEKTDGRIIFTIPSEFTCSQEDITTDDGGIVRVYNIENDKIGNCSFYSGYDDNATYDNLEFYRDGWKDANIVSKGETPIDKGSKEINGNTCLYKIASYNIDGVDVYWRFYMIFDKPTGKIAVLSVYDTNQDISYFESLLNSIRFQ